MPNRLLKSTRPHTAVHAQNSNFSIHQDNATDASRSAQSSDPARNDTKKLNDLPPPTPPQSPSSRPKLTPASPVAMNSRNSVANGVLHHDTKQTQSTPPANNKSTVAPPPTRMASTIRPVRSFEETEHAFEDTSSDGTTSAVQSRNSNSAFSSSVNSNVSAISFGSLPEQHQQQTKQPKNSQRSGEDKTPSVRLKQSTTGIRGPSTPTLEVPIANGQAAAGNSPRSSVEIPQRESSLAALSVTTPPIQPAPLAADARTTTLPTNPNTTSPIAVSLSATETNLSNAWDSTIGKAGLGKTGRVINRLVSDNEALKRDIQIERLRADESRQAARLVEDKMERLVSEYESRLLEANVTKTLLARKERQVESLHAAVEAERRRAADAAERERVWKAEMERVRAEAKRAVDEASSHAALMEGRYTAISSHWREQGDEVRRTVAGMGAQIEELGAERRRDDDKITTLRELCDQQDGNIRDLRRQKEEISQRFDAYRSEQEEALRGIKTAAGEREAEQERMLGEAKEVLDKLKWALSVRENVHWAQ